MKHAQRFHENTRLNHKAAIRILLGETGGKPDMGYTGQVK